MAGFGKPQQSRKTRHRANVINIEQAIRHSLISYQQGDLTSAKALLDKSIEAHHANSFALGILATIEKALGNNVRASHLFEKSISINGSNPDFLHNYSDLLQEKDIERAVKLSDKALELSPKNSTYLERNGYLKWKTGDLYNALKSTIKAIEIKPDLFAAYLNLGGIHKDLGNLDQALASTLKSLEFKPDNPNALMNLGGIYKELGNLDQALASTLKSLEIEPGSSTALSLLGSIQMAQGKTEEARKNLLNAIKQNPQEYGAYYELSKMLKTIEEASELVKAINSAKALKVTATNRYFIEFAISNCFHKAENYDEASKHLHLANKNKLTVKPSNANEFQRKIASNLSYTLSPGLTSITKESGNERIFIVGMPRSGSTLLETILSMSPEIKDLGESSSLTKAIARIQQQKGYNSNYQNLNEIYSRMEPIDKTQFKYTTDKNLYNFTWISLIASHMPAAKIIHCRRNPMDNILSMYRSNLSAGNNYTASLEDSAKVLIAQEQAMQIKKKRYPEKIFTFDYDQFVNAPEVNLRKLLGWLNLEFDDFYLHPEKSTRSVNTASVMQARKPISNKSVGGWKNYKNLLNPALKILQESGIKWIDSGDNYSQKCANTITSRHEIQ